MVLRESLELAREEPKIFVPKTIYILISSLWMIGLFSTYGKNPIYIAAFPILMYISFFTSVMIAKMAKSPEKESLISNFLYVFNMKKSLTYLVIAVFFISFLISLPIASGAYLVLQTSYTILGYFLIASGAILSIIASFFLFFIPISFIESSNINSTIKDSYSMSKGNSKEVLLLFIISIILLGASQISEGVFRDLSIAGFLLARVLESFASTYVFILGSKFYLEKKELKK